MILIEVHADCVIFLGMQKKKKKKGKKHGGSSDDDSSDGSGSGHGHADSDSDSERDKSDTESESDADLAAFAGGKAGAAAPGKLFENDGAAKDEDEEEAEGAEVEEEEDEGGGEYLMKEHPIFGKWFKMLDDGKPRAEVLATMANDNWNPALLDVDANAPVPESVAAATVPLKDWEYFQKYFKMMKVGLPRPVVEHKMLSESCNPAALDADPDVPLPANQVSPPKKKKNNKPQIVRKKLHWVPIKVCTAMRAACATKILGACAGAARHAPFITVTVQFVQLLALEPRPRHPSRANHVSPPPITCHVFLVHATD